MALFSFVCSSWTPVPVADTTGFTAAGFCAIQGGSSTQLTYVTEVYMGGAAAASAPMLMKLSRDSTVAVTPTALSTGNSNAALDPSTAALAAPVAGFVAAGTEPQRAATLGLLSLGLNAFGGIVRWVAAPGEMPGMLGNTASLGEISLSAYTGGTAGLINSHIIYESK